ncbi:MAG: DUF3786 domain-containing protein [Peptococcaceae bacterium]|jgi:hypothetical protein|nr:DUF3786 domain-containing protein [Peptococcaceae bacterium]
MENIGYHRALNLAKAELAEKKPEEVAENTGVTWNGATYEVPWLGRLVPLEEGSIDEQIIWHHYMTAQGPKKPRDRYIAYKQVPGGAIYNSNFIKRSIQPMVDAFHANLDVFLERGLLLGGKKVSLGDMSFTLPVLPYVPLTFVIWQGDDEIPPNGNILFDETAIEWFNAEDLVVIASLPVYKLLKMNAQRTMYV